MVRVYFFILLGLAFHSQVAGQSDDSSSVTFLSEFLKTAGYSHTTDELSNAKFYRTEFLGSEYPYHKTAQLQLSDYDKSNLVRVPKFFDNKTLLCKE